MIKTKYGPTIRKSTVVLPALYIDHETNLIVLIAARAGGDGSGACIQQGTTTYLPGYFTNYWKMNKLEPYYGELILENVFE